MNPHPKAPSAWISVFRTITLASPALTILALISIYGVNVPVWDQWDQVPPLIEKLGAGTLRLSDFFAQHNEHRIFFPRLVKLCLALLTHWNIKADLFTSWVLASASAYNLCRLKRVTVSTSPAAGFWLLLGTNILLFTTLQWEDWLFGEIAFFLPLTAVTSLLWIVPSSRTNVAFLAAIAFSIVAAFSIASGFVAWFLALLLLLFPNGRFNYTGRKGWLLVFLLIFISIQILYLWKYQTPSHHPSPLIPLRHPLRAIRYILAYFGSTFAFGTAFSPVDVAIIVGGVLLVLFCACLTYLFFNRNDYILIERTLPWVALCLFAIANSIITASGRVGFGTTQALSSRYVTYSVTMPIGLIFLTHLVFDHWQEQSTSRQYVTPVGRAIVSVTAILALLLTLSTFTSLGAWALSRHDRICAKALVQLVNVIEDPNAFRSYVYPDAAHKEICKEMNRLGFLQPALLQTKLIREIAKATVFQESTCGSFDQITELYDGHFAVSGWSVFPKQKKAAVATLLTYDDDSKQANIFAIAFQNLARPDVVSALQTQGYLESGWSSTIDSKQLPPGQRTIRAWAFDPETCRAYELNGTKVINRMIPEYRLGLQLGFVPGAEGTKYLGYGWSQPEPWGVWSEGDHASILLLLDREPKSDVILQVDASGFICAKCPQQQIGLSVNGTSIGELTYALENSNGSRSFLLPREILIAHHRLVEIQLQFKNDVSPARLGLSSDSRDLALGLKALTLKPVDSN